MKKILLILLIFISTFVYAQDIFVGLSAKQTQIIYNIEIYHETIININNLYNPGPVRNGWDTYRNALQYKAALYERNKSILIQEARKIVDLELINKYNNKRLNEYKQRIIDFVNSDKFRKADWSLPDNYENALRYILHPYEDNTIVEEIKIIKLLRMIKARADSFLETGEDRELGLKMLEGLKLGVKALENCYLNDMNIDIFFEKHLRPKK